MLAQDSWVKDSWDRKVCTDQQDRTAGEDSQGGTGKDRKDRTGWPDDMDRTASVVVWASPARNQRSGRMHTRTTDNRDSTTVAGQP